MNRNERILHRKGSMGNRHDRRLEKYSDGFNENFKFFFLLSRTGLVNFCGERITVEPTSDKKMSARYCFRLFEDGNYRMGKTIRCSQPNILRHALMGKKGWGLWKDQWSEGIGDRLFRKEEIVEEFVKLGIQIPGCFMLEFDKAIEKKKADFTW